MSTSTTTVRVSESTHEKLRALAVATGQPLTAVVELAVEALRRERFFIELDAAYSRLRAGAEAWEEVTSERADWDVTLADGLDQS